MAEHTPQGDKILILDAGAQYGKVQWRNGNLPHWQLRTAAAALRAAATPHRLHPLTRVHPQRVGRLARLSARRQAHRRQ